MNPHRGNRLSWWLFLLGFFTVCSSLLAEPVDSTTDTHFLVQDFNVDRLDLKLSGKIVLNSLDPLQGEIQLKQGRGDLIKILEFFSRWVPVPVDFTKSYPLYEVDFRNAKAVFGPSKRIHITMDTVTLADGTIQKAELDGVPEKHWKLLAEEIHLKKSPSWLKTDWPVSGLGVGHLMLSTTDMQTLQGKADWFELEGSRLENISGEITQSKEKNTPSTWHLQSKGGLIDAGQGLERLKSYAPIEKIWTAWLTDFGLAGLSLEGQIGMKNLDFLGLSNGQAIHGSTLIQPSRLGIHLQPVVAGDIPEINLFIHSEGRLNLSEDQSLQMEATTLNLHNTKQLLASFKNGLLDFKQNQFSLSTLESELKPGLILNTLEQVPTWRKSLNETIKPLRISNLKPSGTWTISQLNTTLSDGKIQKAVGNFSWKKGSLDLTGLPVSDNYQWLASKLNFPRFMANIDHHEGLTRLDKVDIRLHNAKQGVLRLSGQGDWPIVANHLTFKAETKKLPWRKWRIDSQFEWDGSTEHPMKMLATHQDGTQIETEGRSNTLQGEHLGLDLILYRLLIREPEIEKDQLQTQADKDTQEAEVFLPQGPPKLPFPMRIQADRITYNQLPSLEGVQLIVQPDFSGPELSTRPLRLSWVGDWCKTRSDGDMHIQANGNLSIQTSMRIRDVTLGNLIGCSMLISHAKAPPIQIQGKAYGRTQIRMQGKNWKDLKQSMIGDGSLTVNKGQINNLKFMHESLGFIIDLLRFTGTNLRDTVEFNQLVLRLKSKADIINFSTVKFVSKLFNVWGKASLDLHSDPSMLHLDLQASSPLSSKTPYKKSFSLHETP